MQGLEVAAIKEPLGQEVLLQEEQLISQGIMEVQAEILAEMEEPEPMVELEVMEIRMPQGGMELHQVVVEVEEKEAEEVTMPEEKAQQVKFD
jgi:hypothetical protein